MQKTVIFSIETYTVMVLMGSVDLKQSTQVCFIAAGMNKMEVKNQQIQTEVAKTVEQHVQAGSTAEQQSVYKTHFIPLCDFYVAYLLVIQQIKHV